ncbi:uncharacterized protein LOC100208827 isoform X1 [Hydra vulgaris]|uniref:uncharacterized protein LOC100208827 isoform X1 n=1 Tax=Hydra vulgaris TaxID=6087 RepID=UPI001F5FBCC9|nr:uncharacterized protein LOC100208827 isoform X1 [Hydra vulgaris]
MFFVTFYIMTTILLSFEKQVSSQQWLTETDRQVYAQDKSQLSLEWNLDKQGQKIFYATWKLVDETNTPLQTLLSVDAKGNMIVTSSIKTICNPAKVFVDYLNITFLSLDQLTDNRIFVSIDFNGLAVPLTDLLYINYVAPLKFTQDLPPNVTYIEDSESSKNISFTVVAKGNPKPSLYWKFNEKNITSYADFVLSSEELPFDGLYMSIRNVLFVKQIKVEYIGVINVLLKYGDETQQSPQIEEYVEIDVWYPPKEVVLTSNLTTFFVLTNYFVNLTCSAGGNPPPRYTISKADTILFNSLDNSVVTYLDPYEDSLASFLCIAENIVGKNQSNVLNIRVFNGSDYIRQDYDTGGNEWWIYYLVIVAVTLVVFIGFVGTIFVVRRKMRSMNIMQQTSQLRFRSNRSNYERAAMRNNRPNHGYDLNQRGAPDGQRDTNVYSTGSIIKSSKTAPISTIDNEYNFGGVVRKNSVQPLPLKDLNNPNVTDELSDKSVVSSYQNNGFHY